MRLGAVRSGRFQRLLGAWPRGCGLRNGAICLQLLRPLCPGMTSSGAPKDLAAGVRGVRKDRGQVLHGLYFPLALAERAGTLAGLLLGRVQGPVWTIIYSLGPGPGPLSSCLSFLIQPPHPGVSQEDSVHPPPISTPPSSANPRPCPLRSTELTLLYGTQQPLTPASASGWGPHAQPGTW